MKKMGWWMGGAALMAALGGCTDEYSLPNLSPEVTALEYCQQGDRTYLILEVFDHERDSVDVSIDLSGVSACGGGDVPMAVGPTGSGITGLNSERADHPRAISGDAAQLHRVEWASTGDHRCASETETSTCCTLPADLPETLTLRIRATDSEQFTEWDWTGEVSLSDQSCDELMMADGTTN